MNMFKNWQRKETPAVRDMFRQQFNANCVSTDRIFTYLLPSQWLFAVVCGCVISPSLWSPATSSTYLPAMLALVAGALLTVVPTWLTLWRAGRWYTRWCVAFAQSGFSILLIQLMAGRPEALFHVFVSLALLAAYRDRSILWPAVALTIIDQLVRGLLWQYGVLGTASIAPLRALEHAGWIAFEVLSLSYIISCSDRQSLFLSRLQCSLRSEKMNLETRVRARTRDLETSKEFQDKILNSIDAQICILSESGEIEFVNNQCRDFLNSLTQNETLQVWGSFYDFLDLPNPFGPKFATEARTAINSIAQGQTTSFTAEYCTTQTEKWFQLCVSQVPQEGKLSIAVVLVDITSVKAAQARAASLAKIILESPNEVFLFRASDLQFIEVNQGACDNLQYSREELLSLTPASILPKISTEDLASYITTLTERQLPFIEVESSQKRKDGSEYPSSLKFHYGVFDSVEVIVMFAADLTQHKELQLKLAQSQKMESLGQLAAGIAHEINTPMQCVFGNVEFLQSSMNRLFAVTDACIATLEQSEVTRQAQDTIAEIRKSYRFDHVRKQFPLAIDEASEASKRVISIVRAMKIMSHPGTKSKVLTDLHELIQNAATITQNRWKYVAKMNYAFDSKVKTIYALPAELSQVFINLFVNAADAIGEKIGPEPSALGQISVKTELNGQNVIVTVADSGCGMTEEVRRKMFDPFFTTKEVGKGTGQGLAITYDVVVNQHAGAIDAQSEYGQGSKFLLTLPIEHTEESIDTLPLDTIAYTAVDTTSSVSVCN